MMVVYQDKTYRVLAIEYLGEHKTYVLEDPKGPLIWVMADEVEEI